MFAAFCHLSNKDDDDVLSEQIVYVGLLFNLWTMKPLLLVTDLKFFVILPRWQRKACCLWSRS